MVYERSANRSVSVWFTRQRSPGPWDNITELVARCIPPAPTLNTTRESQHSVGAVLCPVWVNHSEVVIASCQSLVLICTKNMF